MSWSSARPILLVLAAALAGCLAASAVASAYEFEVESKPVTESTLFEGSTKGSAFKLETAEIAIECKEAPIEGHYETEGKSTATLRLGSCTSSKPSKCKVASSITAKFSGQLKEENGEIVDDLTGSGEKQTIAEVKFEDNGSEICSLGTVKLVGSQVCTMPDGEEGLQQQELACSTTGSSLELNARSATLAGTEHVETPPIPPELLRRSGAGPPFWGPWWLRNKEVRGTPVKSVTGGPTIRLGELDMAGFWEVSVKCTEGENRVDPPLPLTSLTEGANRRVGTGTDIYYFKSCTVTHFNEPAELCAVNTVWERPGGELEKSPANTLGTEAHSIELGFEQGWMKNTRQRKEAGIWWSGKEQFEGKTVLLVLQFAGLECPELVAGATVPLTGNIAGTIKDGPEFLRANEEVDEFSVPGESGKTMELWNPNTGYTAKTASVKWGAQEVRYGIPEEIKPITEEWKIGWTRPSRAQGLEEIEEKEAKERKEIEEKEAKERKEREEKEKHETEEKENAAGPTILPEKGQSWTGKLVSSTFALEKHSGEGVSCKGATLEGTTQTRAPGGAFHMHLKECKGPVGSTCTGLGEESGVILSLGSWHLFYDTLKASLSEAGVAVLFLLSKIHFTCKVLTSEELLALQEGGMVLCLVTNPTANTKAFEFKCKENGKRESEETKYYNYAGTLINITRLKVARNENTTEEAVEVVSGTQSTGESVLLML